MDINTVGSIVGIVGGVAGIVALVVQWIVQLNARRAGLRRHAASVRLRRVGETALLRNWGPERIFDVIVEANLDSQRLIAPHGLRVEDFEVSVTPARIWLGDVPPTSPDEQDRKVKLLGTCNDAPPSGAKDSQQAGGQLSLAHVEWDPRRKPYLPAGLTEEKVSAVISYFEDPTNAEGNLSVMLYQQHPRVFGSEQDRRRFAYEQMGENGDPKELAAAVVGLSVVFTDVAGRRWRRDENGTIELLAPHSRLSRLLRLPDRDRYTDDSTPMAS